MSPQATNCGECDCRDGQAPFNRWTLPDGTQTNLCPRRSTSDLSRSFIAMHAHYRGGFLAIVGGILNQPNAYLEAMRLIDTWTAKHARQT